ncbi:MAG: hypothetical protein VW450_07540 [Chloroflexota bacterium]
MATGFNTLIESLRLGFAYQAIAERYGVEAVKTAIAESIATPAAEAVVELTGERERIAA